MEQLVVDIPPDPLEKCHLNVKKMPKIVIKKNGKKLSLKKIYDFWQFKKKCIYLRVVLNFWQFFDIQRAIFRRVRRYPT